MVETNFRVVHPGPQVYVQTRRARLIGPDLSPDLVERACGKLRYQYGIAAIPSQDDPEMLVVATNTSVPHMRLAHDEWELEVVDTGDVTQCLTLDSPHGQHQVPLLIERALYAHLARTTPFWTLDSPRIWYADAPFLSEDGIAAYHRFEINAVPIDRVGVGVSVDLGTAFFTEETLAYYFAPGISPGERKRRQQLFDRLTERQKLQKGTLLYDNGTSRVKCYFEQAPLDVTCSSTGPIRVKGRTYPSLTAYYEAEYPSLAFNPDGLAIRVSFPGVERPAWVAAERVVIRVMNDALPRRLQSVDKIAPDERRRLVEQFWQDLGPRPFGSVIPGLQRGFWKPSADHIQRLPLVDLTFGQNQRLAAPATASIDAYRDHFRRRATCLEQAGCYDVPLAMTRLLYVAIPEQSDPAAGQRLASDVTHQIRQLTGCPVDFQLVSYTSLSDGIEQLRAASRSGAVVFVLNDEPAAYHEVAFQLDGWRVKRITERTLADSYQLLTQGYFNRQTRVYDRRKGERRWADFVEKSALDVLQLLDVIPFRIDRAGAYDGILVIDVGHDRRHFALSLLLARDAACTPHFAVVSKVYTKPDHQHETINPVMLTDALVKLVGEVVRHRADPLASLLILRDGKFTGGEIKGIDVALQRLLQQEKLTAEARIDLADLRKDSLMSVRLWDVDGGGRVTNPLEGHLVRLNAQTAVVTSTGAATLHQGTAEPYVIVGNGRCSNLLDAAYATFVAAQLNYGNPTVAQRLLLPLKRTDDELKARAAQEIKRLH